MSSLFGAASHQQAHRVTTAHLQAAYPLISEGGLGSRGCYIGRDVFGGAFVYDPWELYAQNLLTGPNMLVIGQIGRGKSALVKTYVWRQLVFGRRAWMLDPKGENGSLCEAVGVEPVALEPHGALRLNPLDPNVGDPNRHPERIRQDQVSVLHAIISASLGRPLTPEERAACELAITDAARSLTGEPTLPDVVKALLAPSMTAAAAIHTDAKSLAQASREAGLELRRLVEGDLAGMFDGRTSGNIDLKASLVSMDLSAVYQSDALGILMVCAASWLQRAMSRNDGIKRIFVVDEAWAILANLAIARWMQASWKLARAYGVQNLVVVHRISDLLAAGGNDSEEVRLARGLLSDSETQVIYAQSAGEVKITKELLNLSDAEADLIENLPRGLALWRVGQRSFMVQHRLGQHERAIVDTDARMTVAA